MREIKFRARSVDGQWHYFTLPQLMSTGYTFDELIAWGQYTGLKSKSGVEIFEGDIVSDGKPQNNHCLAGTHEVNLVDGGFYPFAIPNWEGTLNANECEIIGNIYQDTELLTND